MQRVGRERGKVKSDGELWILEKEGDMAQDPAHSLCHVIQLPSFDIIVDHLRGIQGTLDIHR